MRYTLWILPLLLSCSIERQNDELGKEEGVDEEHLGFDTARDLGASSDVDVQDLQPDTAPLRDQEMDEGRFPDQDPADQQLDLSLRDTPSDEASPDLSLDEGLPPDLSLDEQLPDLSLDDVLLQDLSLDQEGSEAGEDAGGLVEFEGEIISPNQEGQCVEEPFEVQIRLEGPEGPEVQLSLLLNGEEQLSYRAQAPEERTVILDPHLMEEGWIELSLRLELDGLSEESEPFLLRYDRQAPSLQFQGFPPEESCLLEPVNPQMSAQDELDLSPLVRQWSEREACFQIWYAEGEDDCGHLSQLQYRLRLPEIPSLQMNGLSPGLQVEARPEWRLEGPAACGELGEALLSRRGEAAQPLVSGTLLDRPGRYELEIPIFDCAARSEIQRFSFSINEAPIAVPVPAEHPQLDPDYPQSYRVQEGATLILDGRLSSPPEGEDHIVLYEWNFDPQGEFEVQAIGPQPHFPTQEDGIFSATLRVTDGFGAETSAQFRIFVEDIDPLAVPGGPYLGVMGLPLRLDASGSLDNPADRLSAFHWEFGDGEEADGAQVEHIYAAVGRYQGRLTVEDEESSHSAEFEVSIRETGSDPEISGIELPEDLVELRELSFRVLAEPGDPLDPILGYRWSFNGEEGALLPHPEGAETTHSLLYPGSLNLHIQVLDFDSSSSLELEVELREMSMRELLEHSLTQLEAHLGTDPGLQAYQALERGLWAEREGLRGTLFLAMDEALGWSELGLAQGADLLPLIFALGRQAWREMRDLIESSSPSQDPRYIEALRRFNLAVPLADPGFILRLERAPGLARRLLQELIWSHRLLEELSTPCGRFDFFDGDPLSIQAGLEWLDQSITELLAREGLPEPQAVEEFQERLARLYHLQSPLIPCLEWPNCLSAEGRLEQIQLSVELSHDLDRLEESGLEVESWRSCLAAGARGFVEASVQRAEERCPEARTLLLQNHADLESLGEELRTHGGDLALQLLEQQLCGNVELYNDCIRDERDLWRSWPQNCPGHSCPPCPAGTFCDQQLRLCRYGCEQESCPELGSSCRDGICGRF